MTTPKYRADEVEIMVARHFNPRINLIVPNVSWGLGLRHECDMLILRPSGYAVEIEIKVDVYDLRKDKDKRKWIWDANKIIKQTYFAVPKELESEIENIPAGCGFITVECGHEYYTQQTVDVVKPAKVNRFAERLDEKKILKLHRLAAMRIWGLKEKLIKGRKC